MYKNTKKILVTGCVFGALAVGIGALGTHGLKDILDQNDKTAVFDTAVKYHQFHAIAILIVGILSNEIKNPWINRSFFALTAGLLIFSGSLYVLAISNISILGALTPFGGVFLIIGWISLILAIKKNAVEN